MSTDEQIETYLASLPESKQNDMRSLHGTIMGTYPGCRLWFLDGTDARGKVVSNPNIGYGTLTKTYADGKTKEFYQVGISANSAGSSVYIMSIADKHYLRQKYAEALGNATVTGYCIKFKALKDIDLHTLKQAIHDGFASSST